MPIQTETHNPLTWILPLSVGLIVFLLWLIYWKPAATTQADWVTVLPSTNALFNALECVLFGGRIFKYSAWQPNRSHAFYAWRGCFFSLVSDQLYCVSLFSRRHPVSRPGIYSADLFRDSDQPYCAVYRRPADGVHHPLLCRQQAIFRPTARLPATHSPSGCMFRSPALLCFCF